MKKRRKKQNNEKGSTTVSFFSDIIIICALNTHTESRYHVHLSFSPISFFFFSFFLLQIQIIKFILGTHYTRGETFTTGWSVQIFLYTSPSFRLSNKRYSITPRFFSFVFFFLRKPPRVYRS